MRLPHSFRYVVCFFLALGLCFAPAVLGQVVLLEPVHPLTAQAQVPQQVPQASLEQAVTLSKAAIEQAQVGNWHTANDSIAESLAIVRNAKGKRQERNFLLAQLLHIQGQLHFAQGQFAEAIQSWDESATIYQQVGQLDGKIQSRLAQVQAMQSLGLYARAYDEILKPLMADINGLPNSITKANGWLSLGQSQMVIDNLEDALNSFEKSFEVAQTISSPAAQATARLNQANVLYAQIMDGYHRGSLKPFERDELADKQSQALAFYNALQNTAPTPIDRLRARLNQVGLVIDSVPFLQAIAVEERRPRTPIAYSRAQLETLQAQLPYIDEVLRLTQDAQATLTQLPVSHTSLTLQINLAHQQLKIYQQLLDLDDLVAQERFELEQLLQGEDRDQAAQLLQLQLPWLEEDLANRQVDLAAVEQQLSLSQQSAEQLEDGRSQSYLLGLQAMAAEFQGDPERALSLTNDAVLLAKRVDAPDMLYHWYGQWGRLLEQAGQEEEAIAAYRSAIRTIQELRTDLTAVNPEVLFSFRRNVEPLYQRLMTLILKTSGDQPDQATLNEVRDLAELLSIEELSDYLKTDCLQTSGEILKSNRISVEELPGANQTAFIYPILLPDQLAVITSLPEAQAVSQEGNPKRQLKLYAADATEEEVRQLAQDFRQALVKRHSLSFQAPARQIYDWLITPMEADFRTLGINNLVFVSDKVFRNIPMATLYDGERYLIEKYTLATTPGLRLTSTDLMTDESLSVLAFGLTKERTVRLDNGQPFDFDPLPAVKAEIEKIQAQVQSTEPFFDQEFVSDRFQSEVDQSIAPIVHLATHGQFSSDRRETFLVTWDEKPLGIQEFSGILQIRDTLRKSPLKLLVLSACETATGDEKAALGLAGLALQSGARSTVASLWQVSDEATSVLMEEFYRALNNRSLTKAEALRQAQIKVLNDPLSRQHPYFWAPFILVGNWI